MPTLPGGGAAPGKFLSSRLNYPTAAAFNKHLLSKVSITFIIDSEGRPRNPRVVRGLGSGPDEAALRLAPLMPWLEAR